mgnify:CR=1 FL=1
MARARTLFVGSNDPDVVGKGAGDPLERSDIDAMFCERCEGCHGPLDAGVDLLAGLRKAVLRDDRRPAAFAVAAGAFLVAPPDLQARDVWPARQGGFEPVPMQPLPFPAKLIGSSTDPWCSVERTQEMGQAWGADTSIIANAGHLDIESGDRKSTRLNSSHRT